MKNDAIILYSLLHCVLTSKPAKTLWVAFIGLFLGYLVACNLLGELIPLNRLW